MTYMMNIHSLSPRQRKIIQILESTQSFMTSQEIAKKISCSSRTVRSDISEINSASAENGFMIISERSKGYCISKSAAQDRHDAAGAVASGSVQSRAERADLIAFRLCFEKKPLSLFELEDELFISRTTLDKDIAYLKRKYCDELPYVKIERFSESLYMEKDEYKIRKLLNILCGSDFDFGGVENYHKYPSFIDSVLLEKIKEPVLGVLSRSGIVLEDTAVNALMLDIGIAYRRDSEGHYLDEAGERSLADVSAAEAAGKIAEEAGRQLDCVFTPSDINFFSIRIASGRFFDPFDKEFVGCCPDISQRIKDTAEKYIGLIRDIYQIDFSDFNDYRQMLCLFLRKASFGLPCFELHENQTILKNELVIEFEIAGLMVRPAFEELGITLRQTELLYLAFCNQVALDHLQEKHPVRKLKAVVYGHYGLPAFWSMVNRLRTTFSRYMSIEAVLPVSQMKIPDCTDAELVITTGHKNAVPYNNKKTIYLTSLMDDSDYPEITKFIKVHQMGTIVHENALFTGKMIRDCLWMETSDGSDYEKVIRLAASKIFEDCDDAETYAREVIEREKVSTNVMRNDVFFQYCGEASSVTSLCVVFMKRPVTWRSFKIRLAVFGAFRPEHRSVVFHFLHMFNTDALDHETLKMIRSKDDFIEVFS